MSELQAEETVLGVIQLLNDKEGKNTRVVHKHVHVHEVYNTRVYEHACTCSCSKFVHLL